MAKIHYAQPKTKIPEISIHDFLYGILRNRGDKLCMIDATNHKSMTCREVLLMSQQFASGLAATGLGKNDIISFYVYNSMELGCMLLGSLQTGATVNTINPACTPYELRHYLKDVKPKLVFTEADLVDNITSALTHIGHQADILLKDTKTGYKTIQNMYNNIDDVISKEAAVTVDVRDDVALILFSSGTTGFPKGVMLTHYNIVAYLVMKQELVEEKAAIQLGGKEIIPFPMYHAGGIQGGLFSCIPLGKVFIFFEKYTLELLLEAIERYKPDGFFLPPSVIVQLTKTPLLDKYDISSVKYCRMGAAPVQRETEEAFQRRFHDPLMLHGYGLSENVGGALRRGYPLRHKRGSVGKPFPGVQVKVVEPDTGVMLGPNRPGELLVRGPFVMKGYLNNPEATRDTIDREGWLHTGDVGYYDDDDCFYIVDRLKELIKYKGNQVAPAELEAVLLEHPDIVDSGVIGIADPVAGELPRAYIVPREGSGLTADSVNKHVQDRVAYYKWLRGGIVFVESIPKLPSGKILRRTLRDWANKSKL